MSRKIRVIVRIDPSCEMAMVEVDSRHKLGLGGMTGNVWDFHPGCHGITEYGDFRGYRSLQNKIVAKIQELGHEAVIDFKVASYPKDF